MNTSRKKPGSALLLILLLLLAVIPTHAQALQDVTQPGDDIIGTSNNTPGSEGVANVIDNQQTKYLNFDELNTGFTVRPSVGLTVVSGITLLSANDAPARDPISYVLSGSNDGTNFVNISSGPVPAFTARYQTNRVDFQNSAAYKWYRLIFPEVFNPTEANSMQIAEVELLGVVAPSDVTQPGDTIVGSSNNTPGSEGVGNVIDNQRTKYLNFDKLNTGFTVTPSVGGSIVTGIGILSANDAIARDPTSFSLEGSLDGTNFVLIASNSIPVFNARYEQHNLFFANTRAFSTYRVIFPTVFNETEANSMQVAEVELFGVAATVPQDVTQPGDTIVGTSNNTPGSEGVANAIDNQQTKYLNFDKLNTGFTVTPGVGATILQGITLTSANDAEARDPASYRVEGTLDGANFTLIAEGTLTPFTARYQKKVVFFDNDKVYNAYRVVFPTVANETEANSMQIAEVELLGFLGPQDVTQPGDTIVGTSNNTPGSEGVGNAIDNQQTKYLNFDKLNTGFTVTPSVGRTLVTGISLLSANDAEARDPASYTLSGSTDGQNFTLISSGSVPVFPSRYFKHTIFFENENEYTSYRLIFPTVLNETDANSMQIAEVELLGYVREIRTDIQLIRVHPENTPVLLGSQATFQVVMTGPWSAQWYRNGARIAGATQATYTTPAATAADDGAVYEVEVTGAGGVQRSSPATLSIFTPSATTSIGLNWVGGGGNGAPTSMNETDIAGFHPQAYWNNLTGGSGDLASPTNSSNVTMDNISVNYQSSGAWGVGTGTDSPNRRMLNGILALTGANSVGTVSIFGVPAGNHSIILYTVQVPLEFFQMDFTVSTWNDATGLQNEQKIYIRPQNSDEFNPSPGFIRVSATTPQARGVGNMIRFDNVRPGSDGTITITFRSPDWVQPPGTEPRRGPGLNAMQLLLDPPALGAPPSITVHPVSANAVVGGGVRLEVQATGDNLTYQWLKDGQPIFGATGSSFSIHAATDASPGNYRVAISNAAGRVLSNTAVIDVVPSVNITDGLVAHLKFDETSGTTAANSATGGQAGALRNFEAGAAHWQQGKIGGALAFDGTATHVFVPDYAKTDDTLTVSAWVKPTGDGAGSAAWGGVVNNWLRNRAVGSRGQFFLRGASAFDVDNNAIANVSGGIAVGPNIPTATGALAGGGADQWQHVVLTADGASATLYVNGVAVGRAEYLSDINPAVSPFLAIGAELVDSLDLDGDGVNETVPPQIDPAGPQVFSGLIDDVAVWNRSLSAPEVAAVFAAGNAGQNAAQTPPVLDDEPLPGGTPTLAVSSEAGDIVVSFTNGSLEATADLTQAFAPVQGATSPYRVTPANQQRMRFFRVRGQ